MKKPTDTLRIKGAIQVCFSTLETLPLHRQLRGDNYRCHREMPHYGSANFHGITWYYTDYLEMQVDGTYKKLGYSATEETTGTLLARHITTGPLDEGRLDKAAVHVIKTHGAAWMQGKYRLFLDGIRGVKIQPFELISYGVL